VLGTDLSIQLSSALPAFGRAGRPTDLPGIETRPGYLQQSRHAHYREVRLLHCHQLEFLDY
jgi:hypothetical protein